LIEFATDVAKGETVAHVPDRRGSRDLLG